MGSGPELLVQGGVSLPNANPYSRVLREGEPTAAAAAVWSQGKSSRKVCSGSTRLGEGSGS